MSEFTTVTIGLDVHASSVRLAAVRAWAPGPDRNRGPFLRASRSARRAANGHQTTEIGLAQPCESHRDRPAKPHE
jgi:hypothetical protein